MKAWLMNGTGGVSALRLGEIADPIPGPQDVVLELEYASLNPADRYVSEGQYPGKPPMPHILGRDGVGTVIAVGSDPGNFKVGDKLIILRGEIGVTRAGTFAQRVAAPIDSLTTIPPGWSPQESAAAPLVYLTAYQALTQWGNLPPSNLLITGASGGVGVAGVQLASAMGHTVIALSRDPAKRQTLKTLGASLTVDPNDDHWRRQVKDFLAPRRVDLAIDNVGGALLPQVIETMGDHGKISVVGRLAGPVPEFNTATLFFRRLRLGGVAVGAYTRPEAHAAWTQIVHLLARANARPLIDHIYKFEDLPAAFDRLAQGPMGKVLLQIKGK